MNAIELTHRDTFKLRRISFFNPNLNFEFWPTWLIYLPIIPYALWLALKARSLTFFSAANPLMFLGGLVGESKSAILKAIPEAYLPPSIFVPAKMPINEVLEKMNTAMITFPIVIKPDIGERGNGVAKLNSTLELVQYLNNNHAASIVQSFSEYPIELGILYYRFPNGQQSGITSIVSKAFLTVKGDGKTTLETLIRNEKRAQARLDYLFNTFNNRLDEVLPEHETLVLEPIGNHCRGTAFHNANHLITPTLVKIFDDIASQIDGFDIGRFDLKVNSIADLYNGEHIHILELNGVTSEPTHIYDPNESLISNYKALFQHWKLIYQIAIQNRQSGVSFAPVKTIFDQLFKSQKTK